MLRAASQHTQCATTPTASQLRREIAPPIPGLRFWWPAARVVCCAHVPWASSTAMRAKAPGFGGRGAYSAWRRLVRRGLGSLRRVPQRESMQLKPRAILPALLQHRMPGHGSYPTYREWPHAAREVPALHRRRPTRDTPLRQHSAHGCRVCQVAVAGSLRCCFAM